MMKPYLALAALISVSICAVAQKSANASDFRVLEKKMFDASVKFLNNDKADFLALLDETYFTVNADGSAGDKAALVKMQFPVQQIKIDRIEPSEFKMRDYGNVVVITGKSKYFSKGQMLAQVMHTEVWVRRGDGWKFANWQGTPLPAGSVAK